MSWQADHAEYRRAHRAPVHLLAQVIHESANALSGDVQPVTELYELLVRAGRHHVVEQPRTEA